MTNAYPNYKPSGIDWLGDIPAHWEVKKLKYLLQSVKNDSPGGTLRIAVENIESRTGRLVSLSDEKVIQGNATGFRPDDVVFNKLRPYLAKVYYATEQGGSFGELLILRSKGELYGKYTFYRLLSDEFISKVDSSTEGTKMPRANWDEYIAHLKIQYPPLAEQIAIAEYLDKQTAQVDELVAQKRELVSLLQEERAGIINDAVTQGLNHRAPRKESGLPWLGKIPTHWEVKKLKYVARLRSGDSITADFIRSEGDFPVYGGNGLRGYTTSFTHEGSYVLIGRQGALCGNINYAEGRFWASEHAVVVTIQSGDQFQWLGKLLETMHLNQYSVSAAQPGLAIERVRELYIPVPPINEQVEIISYLDLETARIDDTIQTIEQEINLVTEYRSALISEVVTGKQKVN